MAKALSNMLLKGIGSFNSTRTTALASGSSYQHLMRFSTTASNDSDTHDDFKPTDKLENTGVTLKDIIEQDVKENPVMLYMKGDPNRPLCGFSSLAVKILQEYRVPISSRNILEDIELKNAVKAFSTWPTFPQIFINGEFIGGSDIILDMHKKGELEEKLKAAAAAASRQ
uniref:monothiol glutaredoxin-S15, mitochondrial-like n=1 Tax=Erigeron canadensis TaxID=72917 RepID=UPI001CB8ED76|nr:monothiol glutaredoxin-S15, mitochondrial-like [Erigeron canadensis]